ncbi:glycosyltransferase family 87 protein [Sphingomicrobium sp. XHP0239]|uniref:glycosyltransferase family 87 protein n=1 Tax=Sphingomicrobium maritimum TaxID=3133972 RepID=UPI0031CC4774
MEDERFAPDRENRPPPLIAWAALLVFISLPAFQYALGDWFYRDGLLLDGGGTWFGRDFTNLYLGGRLVLDDVAIYDVSVYQRELKELGIVAGQNSSYPPTVYLLGAPLSQLDYFLALGLWHVGGALLFVLAARRHITFPWPWLFLFPAMVSIPNGQYGLYTAGLWMLAFAGSGVAAGLLTIKPHVGILLALAMAVQQRWRMILVACAVALGLLVVAELAFGLTQAFLTDGLWMQSRILLTDSEQQYFGSMTSAYVWFRGTPFAWPAQIAFSIAALVLIAPLVKLPFKVLVFPLATATFLILPYAFAYDMAVVLLGIASLVWRDWGRLTIVERVLVVAAALAIAKVVAVPVALLAILLLQRRIALAEQAQNADNTRHEEDRNHHQTLQAG